MASSPFHHARFLVTFVLVFPFQWFEKKKFTVVQPNGLLRQEVQNPLLGINLWNEGLGKGDVGRGNTLQIRVCSLKRDTLDLVWNNVVSGSMGRRGI